MASPSSARCWPRPSLSNKGIGFLIINAYSTFDMPRMYALLIVLFVLSIGVNALVGRFGGLDKIKQA